MEQPFVTQRAKVCSTTLPQTQLILPDVPTIFALISELAAYEQHSSSVTASEELLAKSLSFADPSSPTTFSPGYAKTLLVTAPDGHVAGMAVYFNNYSTWAAVPGIYVEDLFVRPEFQRRGYATAMMKALAQEVLDIGGQRLDWVCLRWNKPGLEFFKSFESRYVDAWVGLRLDGSGLHKYANGQKSARQGGEVVSGEAA
jgi:GNAT superfamily N-acetyltransferase